MSADIENKLVSLNADLKDDKKFKEFKSDPAEFTKRYGVPIDADLASKLKNKLTPFNSLQDMQGDLGPHGPAAFAAAIASGALAVSSVKIAAAIV